MFEVLSEERLRMNELAIKTHDFERSKNQLKEFSQQTPTDLELRKVNISGGFLGLGDHKVTGYELNSLTSQIQDYFIDFNSLHTKFIKEFGQVYNALEALDKDYIQAILIAIKAAEKANNEVKVAQSDITKTIELQKKTIHVLKQFKEKIEGYKHLVDIDKMWNDSQKLQKDVITFSNNVANVTATIKGNTQELKFLNKFKEQIEKIKHLKDVDELWNDTLYLKKVVSSITEKLDNITVSLDKQVQTLEALVCFKEKIESYKHFEDIDKMWEDTLKIHDDISSINNDINSVKESAKSQSKTIEVLSEFKRSLEENKHFKDIDILWNQAENVGKVVTGINAKMDELVQFKDKIDEYEHLKDIDETWDKCKTFEIDINLVKFSMNAHQEQNESLKNSLQEIQNQSDKRNQTFTTKLKTAYVLAGSSLGIAIIELVLIMMRIL